jgi:putative membrane-bound dehydrogenase-like protein
MNRWTRLLCLACPCIFTVAASAQVPPEKAEATFTVADGLEFKLWASEPLFVNPTCIDIDHKGRVWVCESVNYRHTLHRRPPNRKEGDRIVILEDTKGTGKADKATTFYQSPELLAPMGIAVAKDPTGPGYKVFVCQSPDILVFTDSKGEGKADGPPKKLLTGFNGIDHDHGVHGILIGPDMKLYFSVGDQGVKDLQSSDGKGRKWTSNNTDCRAGTIWRCDLDGKNLELIAHNFRNEYEPCVDSFGTVFTSDNDDDGNQQTRICYVMPGGNYGYHPRGPGQTHWHEEQPGVVPKILRTYFGSPTGICVYEGTLLPKKYWGQLLHTDAGPRHVRCYHLKENGAGYDVDREDIVTSTDNWFRPSDVCVAPDGSVFVADWYDPGVGGHGMGDTTRGRIFRLAPKGNKPSLPKIDLDSTSGLLGALGSPNLAVRYMALAKLRSLETHKVRDLCEKGLAEKENVQLKARVLWQVASLAETLGERPKKAEGLDREIQRLRYNAFIQMRTAGIKAALKDPDPRIRATAIRICHDYFDTFVNTMRESALFDDSRLVCREALLAIRDHEPAKVVSFFYELARQYDGKDRFYLEAIGIAVGHHDKARREIILADFDKHFPEWNEKVADLVWELQPPSVMPTLGKRLTDAKIPAAQRARIVDILAASDDKDAAKSLLKVLESDVPAEVRAKVLDNLKLFLPGKWRDLRGSKELTATANRLLESERGRLDGLALVSAAELTDAAQCVHTFVLDARQPMAVRREAIKTLGHLPTPTAVSALEAFLYLDDAKKEPALASEAVQALGEQVTRPGDRPSARDALKALQEAMLSKDLSEDLKRTALEALAGSRPGTTWLLDLHGKKQLPENLVADAGRPLRNSPHQDLRNRAMIAFPPVKLDPKKLPSLTALAARRGDAARGKQILADSVKNNLQCLKCHTVRGSGGQVGPDLSMIGKKASRENLFESILYPSKAIADQYVQWQIETKKGLNLLGIVVEETPDSVTLRDANGKDTKIDKKEIESRTKSPKSIMPDDVAAYVTEDDLVDMVEYLFSLKTPALGMDYWYVVGPFDNGDADAGLDKVFPPEKDIDRKASYDGKSGKVSWRTVKPDAHGYVDLQAFFAPASNNVVSYLYRDVESPADQEATILLGTDDCSKLWVNGELVHTNRQHRAAAPEQDAVKVKLKKGKNRLLLKINNGDGAHGFYLTLLAEQELKRVE